MIKPLGMSDALQRALMGLGDVGTAIQENRTNTANVAATNAQTANTQAALPGVAADAGMKQISLGSELKRRQLLNALGQNNDDTQRLQSAAPQPAQDPLNGAAGPLLPGQERMPAGVGVLSNNSMAQWQQLPKDHASLMAKWYMENGKPELGTPEAVTAYENTFKTQTQNAGTLSNQAVTAGQQGIDTGALNLGTARATQPAEIAAKNQEPALGRAKIGLMGAQSTEANAKAAKDLADVAAGGDIKQIAATERQAKERFDKAGKETGFDSVKDNWANIQSAVQQANDPKAKDKVAADYTLLDQYLKMVNPGMGVRSSNMEMFANSMGLSDKIKSGMLKVQQGGKFDPDVRNAIFDMAKGIYGNHEKSYLEKLNAIDEGLSATPGASRERVFGKTMAARISGAAPDANSDPLGILK